MTQSAVTAPYDEGVGGEITTFIVILPVCLSRALLYCNYCCHLKRIQYVCRCLHRHFETHEQFADSYTAVLEVPCVANTQFAFYRMLPVLLQNDRSRQAQSPVLPLHNRNQRYICRSAFDAGTVKGRYAESDTKAIVRILSCWFAALLLREHCFYDMVS